MADFGNLEQLEAELERFGNGADPLVRRLPRRPGQKEERWAQLLTGAIPEPGVGPDPRTDVMDSAGQGRSPSPSATSWHPSEKMSTPCGRRSPRSRASSRSCGPRSTSSGSAAGFRRRWLEPRPFVALVEGPGYMPIVGIYCTPVTQEMHEPTFLVLTALADMPRHGYAVIQEVERSDWAV